LKDSIVARRYAKSLVSAAADEGELRALFDEFRTAARLLTEPELLEFWKNPSISVGRKCAMVEDLASRIEASDKFASFLRVLAEKNRIKLLATVLVEFTLLARAALGEVAVVLETPFDLTEEEKNDLGSILKRKLGRKIILEIRINEELIAGACVKVGNKVVDGSLRMKLRKLKDTISARE
jgi:F-type H+-transporting ATPase subunit delta